MAKRQSRSDRVFIFEEHALVRHKLSMMKAKDCETHNFRDLTREIGAFLCFSAAENFGLSPARVVPYAGVETTYPVLEARKAVVVPLLRGGLVVAEGALQAIPSAHIGHMGFFRPSEDKPDVEPYLIVLPEPEDRDFILCDISVRTGTTLVAAIQTLVNVGADVNRIFVLSILLADEGIRLVRSRFPEVRIYGATVLTGLDSSHHNYPEFGDPDARLFGVIPGAAQ